MSAANDTRLVPMTREQRDAVRDKVGMQPTAANHTLAYIVDAYDAAPADPAEAIQRGIAIEMHEHLEGLMQRQYHEGHVPTTFEQHEQMWMARAKPFVATVLAALGAPKATP